MKRWNIMAAAVLAAMTAAACSRPEAGETERQEYRTLSMGGGAEGETLHLAGMAIASVIGNTVPKTYAAIETSKGSPVNARNVSEGKLDLAMVSGETAYDAFYGVRSFEGEKMENLRALGACYPIMSSWIAGKETGLAFVHDLPGHTVSAGTQASWTDTATRAVFSAMGIDEESVSWEPYGLAEGAQRVRDGWTEAAHGFSSIPVIPQRNLAQEMELTVLAYTDEEIEAILDKNPFYYHAVIPAGTYEGQEEDIPTFGVKILLCAAEEMDEELAYEIAMALDVNGVVYTGGYDFMAPMQDKTFLADELPIPLHEGALRYYREQGYIK